MTKVVIDRKIESRYKFQIALDDIHLEYLLEELEKSDSWRDMDIYFMVDKLQEEMGEVLSSIKIDDNYVEICKELADLGCVATMLYSKFDELKKKND